LIRLAIYLGFVVAATMIWSQAKADEPKVNFFGAGWVQYGYVEKSFTPPSLSDNDYNKNMLEYAGGLFGASARIDEHWDGAFGIGAIQVHLSRGNRGHANIWYPFLVPFVNQANISYATQLFSDQDHLKVSLGAMNYDYNPEAKDFGDYLLRGYVYPGNVVSGFETNEKSGGATLFGGKASYSSSVFGNDLILKSETDDYPLYDFSLADLISFRPMAGLELGAGVNLYRLIPQNSKLTSPPTDCQSGDLGTYAAQVVGGHSCAIYDTTAVDQATGKATVDTLSGSLAGTKLMARFRLDPKEWLGTGSWGKNDWVVYGEAAVLGLKDYPKVYDKMVRRIPVMVGFDVPTHGWLDFLSVEIEYYANKNSNDVITAENGSWIPALHSDYNYARDDWKWALYASKVVLGHVKFSGQVANDHTRFGGSHDAATGVEALSVPSDWYWIGKIAYFF